jgi:hypothetical protein
MPTLQLRGLPVDLVGRIRRYARTQDLGVTAGVVRLLTIALDHLDARVAAGQAAHRDTTPEQRSAAARHAVTARWERHRSASEG